MNQQITGKAMQAAAASLLRLIDIQAHHCLCTHTHEGQFEGRASLCRHFCKQWSLLSKPQAFKAVVTALPLPGKKLSNVMGTNKQKAQLSTE